MTHDFLVKMIKWRYTKFYKNEKWKIFVTNEEWAFSETSTIFDWKDKEFFTWANGSISSLWEYNNKIGFKYRFVDIKDNKKYIENNCKTEIEKVDLEMNLCEEKASKIKIESKKIKEREKCFEWYDERKKYHKCLDYKYNNKYIKTNIFYDWIEFNKKYKVDSSSKLFIYNWKIGFIWEKNNKNYIFYDWKIVSDYLDYFNENTCCMNMVFPFKILENGLLHYVFKRWNEFYIWIINLEWKK